MKKSYYSILLICLIACTKKTDKASAPAPGSTTAKTILVKDLRANTDLKNHYTFFSFKTNAIVPLTDSNTTTWDIGLNNTKIIVNGGTSGPGGTQGQVTVGIYDDMASAPETNYKTDDDTKLSYAVTGGSGNGWYKYDAANHIISAIPGRVLVFKTTDNRYVKMEILSYYKGMPANPVNTDSSRFYSFRYMYQPSGLRNF